MANDPGDVDRRRPHRTAVRQILRRILYVIYVLVLGFLGFRGFLWWVYSVAPADFSNTVDACQLHYPELSARGIAAARRDNDELQILLLGASVAEQTGPVLQERLSLACPVPVRVHNAAVSAHTTQDSLNKLGCLYEQGAQFDIIIVYHAINDVRMNCVAAEDFRDDYSHCGWYASFNRKKHSGRMSVRETVSDSMDRMIGLGTPEAEDVAFGAEIKTGPAFRMHLEKIIEMAEQQETPVVLMSFATHFVPGYSRAALESGQLGYASGQYVLGTEVWGHPDNVQKGVSVHNEVIRSVSADHPELPFIDMESELTTIELFTDVCHLSPAGLERFGDVMVQQLVPVLAELDAASRGRE